MKKMKIDDVVVWKVFLNSPPKREKIEKKKAFFLKNGYQQKPIVVNDDNIMLDGYATYLALKELGEKYIEYFYCDNYLNEENPQNSYRINPTIYVYGTHIHNGKPISKEKIWRIPSGKRETVLSDLAIGDKVFVNTRYGNKLISITRMEELNECPVKYRVRKVIAKCV